MPDETLLQQLPFPREENRVKCQVIAAASAQNDRNQILKITKQGSSIPKKERPRSLIQLYIIHEPNRKLTVILQ